MTKIIYSATIPRMLKIRLQRIGRKNEPHFRVVLVDRKHSAQSGKAQEILGSYNPKKGEVLLNSERIKHWLSVGAQASGTVHNFLVDQKIINAKKKNNLPKKTKTKKRKELKKA